VGGQAKAETSERHPEHKVYPYLLRGKAIDRPNQVCAADITYIAMRQGFLYLVAIIDWATRRVLSWRLSNTLTAGFCVEALSEALAWFGKPGIFNTDQGAQFTSDEFTEMLQWSRSRDIHRHKSPADRRPEIRRTPDQNRARPEAGRLIQRWGSLVRATIETKLIEGDDRRRVLSTVAKISVEESVP
jgi:transposase InsO family protein